MASGGMLYNWQAAIRILQMFPYLVLVVTTDPDVGRLRSNELRLLT